MSDRGHAGRQSSASSTTTSLRRYTRIGGLFTLLFAQPLSRIVAMRTSQVTPTADGVEVTFSTVPIQMPAILDDLVRDHLDERGLSLYGRQTPTGSSPAASPDTTCRPRTSAASSSRSASSPRSPARPPCSSWPPTCPAPVLAELLGTTDNNAANWARLAAPGLDRLHRRPRPLTTAPPAAAEELRCSASPDLRLGRRPGINAVLIERVEDMQTTAGCRSDP